MKKFVYNLFTSENGIRMNSETLTYIVDGYKTEDAIRELLLSFKNKYNSSTIEIFQIKNLLNFIEKEKEIFSIKACKYKPNIFSKRYDALKKHINGDITAISMLNEETSMIYGIFYKNKYGRYVLEDDHGVISVDLKNCKNDVFLLENMLVAIEGYKERRPGTQNENMNDPVDVDYSFVCERVFYPTILPFRGENNFLLEKELKLLVFSCVTTRSKGYVDKIATEADPDVIIMSVHEDNVSYECGNVHVIMYPCRCKTRHLPKAYETDDAENKSKLVVCASNPFTLETFNRRISFIDCDIAKYRSDGYFCNKNPLRSFFTSFISQRSYNPFYKADLSYDETPNIIIISQDFYPFVMEIEGVKVASLLPVESNSYLLASLPSNTIEVVSDEIKMSPS